MTQNLSYILLLLLIANTAAGARQQWKYHKISNKSNNHKINMSEIGNELNIFTKEIPYINILLRTEYLENDADNSYVRWFLEHSSVPVTISCYNRTHTTDMISTASSLLQFRQRRDSFVITTESQQLKRIAKRFVQRAGVFFFIITDAQRPKDHQKLLTILNSLWIKYKTYKNFLLTFEGIFYFNPFIYNHSLKKYGSLIRNNNTEPLERLLFRNMNGYPLRIQIFKSVMARPATNKRNFTIQNIYGVDGRVAELLEKKMNFTMVLQKPDPNYFGERTKTGKYNGAIGSIIDDNIDFCFTGFFVKDYLVTEYMDFTVAVYDDKLCIYVPKAKRIPQSILPLFSVKYDVWLSFLLTGFASCIIWWLIRLLNMRLNSKDTTLNGSQRDQFYRICIDTWVVWVRVTILRYPPFNSERAFVASLCLTSVIFGAVFESSLATVFIHPLYYNDIRTLQELDESDLKIMYKYSSMADDLFVSDASRLYASLDKKLVHVENLDADILYEIAKEGGKASVTRANTLLLEYVNFILSKEVNLIHECPKYYTISYVCPKDSPWQETVNNWLLSFLSAGLIVKWTNDMKTDIDIRVTMSEINFEKVDIFKVLGVNDLQLAFYVVLMGNTLAALTLIVEILYRKRNLN